MTMMRPRSDSTAFGYCMQSLASIVLGRHQLVMRPLRIALELATMFGFDNAIFELLKKNSPANEYVKVPLLLGKRK